MPNSSKEAIICFESVSVVILAEQALAGNNFSVRIMPTPSSIRGGCGFCLRFLPEDFERAAAFLLEKGFAVTEAYSREETEGRVFFEKLSISNGRDNVS